MLGVYSKEPLLPCNVVYHIAQGAKAMPRLSDLGLELWSDPSQWRPTYVTSEPLPRPESFVLSAYDKALGRLLRGWVEDELDRSSVSTAPELAEVLQQINDLAFQQESDDLGLLRPTFRALTACMKAMLDLARDGQLLRPSDIGTDRNGDIRICWAADERETELVFPSDDQQEPYLYYSSPDSYGTETELSPPSVSKRIHWALLG